MTLGKVSVGPDHDWDAFQPVTLDRESAYGTFTTGAQSPGSEFDVWMVKLDGSASATHLANESLAIDSSGFGVSPTVQRIGTQVFYRPGHTTYALDLASGAMGEVGTGDPTSTAYILSGDGTHFKVRTCGLTKAEIAHVTPSGTTTLPCASYPVALVRDAHVQAVAGSPVLVFGAPWDRETLIFRP